MENEIFYEEIELQSPANDFAHAIAITIGFQLYFLKIKECRMIENRLFRKFKIHVTISNGLT